MPTMRDQTPWGWAVVIVGITGHRVLAELDKLEAGIDAALAEIERVFEARPLTIVSALAEGADRLVVERALARPDSRLRAVLPFPREEYERDFAEAGSKETFRRLLGQAVQVIQLPRPPRRQGASSPDDAYLAAGQYLVDRCDLLIAVWDGRVAQGRGGTAMIVNLARNYGLPLAWVHAGNRKPGTLEPTSLDADQGLVTYERFVPHHDHFDTDDTEADLAWWASLRPELELLAEKVRPVYRAADAAALVHQRWHRRITLLAGVFGTAAVLFAILQLSGRLPAVPLALAEVVAAALALASVGLGLWAARHRSWLLERHRAERCRMLKFAFLSDPALWSGDPTLADGARTRLDQELAAIRAITPESVGTWAEEDAIPDPPLNLAAGRSIDERLGALIDYYGAKRTGAQLRYFASRAGQNTRWDRFTRPLLPPLFFGSVAAAGGHFLYDLFTLQADGHGGSLVSLVLILLAAGLPVLAGALRTVRGAHEFARNRSRFLAKSVALGHLAERIRADADTARVFADLWGCEQILESEHREWLRLMTEAEWI